MPPEPVPFPAPVLTALRELSILPYENLSKIAAHAAGGNMEATLGLAEGWLERNRETGAGGTCFSLTWWLAGRLREAGIGYALLMGDKGRSQNIHCALRMDWEGRAYLLDPGYLIFEPLPLPGAGLSLEAWIPPNAVRLEDKAEAGAWRLWSGPRDTGRPEGGGLKYRFDFRKRAVGEEEFFAHWEASYRLPMMRYPVLNRVRDGAQYYLQKRSLLVRTAEASVMRKLGREELFQALGTTFGIPESLAREAMDVVLAADPEFFRK
ncbi:MAG: arylamine N-acetyltransferase [Fibrobacteres bacterium]|nr:arylamine N-acetyltransferase [Fibrobacterota bacterium]